MVKLKNPITIVQNGGGPDPGNTKMVRFLDYDGALVTQMTLDEAHELASLPEIPTHAGLTGVRWTHSLATIKSASNPLDVGAIYQNAANPAQSIFYILPRVNETVTLNFHQSVANGVTIDWGDGSATETVATEGDSTATHTYATVDAKDTPLKLTFTPASGVSTSLGWGTSAKNLFNNGSNSYYTVIGAVLGNSEIQKYAFYNCSSLTSVVIPDSVTSIGNGVFYSCAALSFVVIPDSVTNMGNSVFQSCFALTSVVIPNSVTSMGSNVFQYCYRLTSVVIPDSVTSIGNYMFQNCSSLTSVVIPDSVTSIEDSAFQSCSSLTSVVIPDSVTSIKNSAFQFCARLTSVVIPDSATSIGNGAFGGCNVLASVVIPNSVTSMGSNVFQDCYSLSTVTYEDRATMVYGSFFFSTGHCPYIIDCSSFTQVPTVTTSFFTNMPAYTRILVPESLEADWKAANNWSTYASQIVGV